MKDIILVILFIYSMVCAYMLIWESRKRNKVYFQEPEYLKLWRINYRDPIAKLKVPNELDFFKMMMGEPIEAAEWWEDVHVMD